MDDEINKINRQLWRQNEELQAAIAKAAETVADTHPNVAAMLRRADYQNHVANLAASVLGSHRIEDIGTDENPHAVFIHLTGEGSDRIPLSMFEELRSKFDASEVTISAVPDQYDHPSLSLWVTRRDD